MQRLSSKTGDASLNDFPVKFFFLILGYDFRKECWKQSEGAPVIRVWFAGRYTKAALLADWEVHKGSAARRLMNGDAGLNAPLRQQRSASFSAPAQRGCSALPSCCSSRHLPTRSLLRASAVSP
ncbi:hypothetical protein E2C01_072036 [Portunus trituberculatus]|uniref:Uncharacterized protein n=1 Tax=Portunus trituberculatus TaxID=210409 RepID=A0A5B7I6Q6_PORTR|nr:hypothetical protein [Portunus trituberculatus]